MKKLQQRRCWCIVLVLMMGTSMVLGQGVEGPAKPWSHADVGSPAAGNATSADGDSFEITGNGNDIWNNSDNCHYMYIPLEGDGMMQARVVANGTGSNAWAKGGVMIRETLDGDSTNVYVAVTGGNGEGATFQWRNSTGGGSASSRTKPAAVAPPYWVRLVREGDTFTGYLSQDGENWYQEGTSSQDIPMSDPVYIGIAVTSHANGELRTFTFDNIYGEGGAALNVDSASDPYPGKDAIDVPYYVDSLGWTPGETAQTHTVYFGTNLDDVTNGAAASLVADGITETSHAIATELGTMYHWRVDEVAADGTVFPGDVWTFTVEPQSYPIEGVSVTASSEFNATSAADNLVNGSGLSDGLHGSDAGTMWLAASGDLPAVLTFDLGATYKLDTMVVWNQNQLVESLLGFGAKDVVVETSTDGASWSVVEGATLINQGTGSASYAANTTLDMKGAVASQVRVTINSGYGFIGQVGLSEVLINYLPVAAREPQPAHGSVEEGLDTVLQWRSGRGVATHQVVFSDVEADVMSNAAQIGTTDAEVRSFDLSSQGLAYGTQYFWRVIEVGDEGSFESPVWTFQSPTAGIIDDMETYEDAEGLEIWSWWADGFDNPGNGSLVGAGASGNEAETGIVSQGSQSLPIVFDNTSAAVSEATRTFSPSISLTEGNPQALALDVRGEAPAFAEDADGRITISAAGADIWGTADEFRFAYKSLSGNGSITARVHSHTTVHNWSKVGVMIREAATPESTMFMLPITGVNGVRPQGRTATFVSAENMPGGLDGVQENIARDQPVWLRIERDGDNFSGYYSTEETVSNWTPLAGNPWNIPMTPNVLIGLAATSHSVGNTVVAHMSDVSTTGSVSGDWTVEAIGGVHAEGSDADSMYVTLSLGNQSVTFEHPNASITQATAWDSWTIPVADIGFASIDAITIGIGTPGGTPSGAQGTAYVDYIRVETQPAVSAAP